MRKFLTLAIASLLASGCATTSGKVEAAADAALAAANAAQPVATASNGPAYVEAQPLTAAEMARVQRAGAEILFWDTAQRSMNFRAMEATFPGSTARAAEAPRNLPTGQPLTGVSDADIAAYMAANDVAGIMVLQDGAVRLERYGLDFGPKQRWTSFSVAKSITSTLAGQAVAEGLIASVNDPVTKYVPELKGSGYDGVTVEQILTMTSGVKWNEDYTDPNSDVVKMLSVPVKPGQDPNIAYLATLPREAEPGTKWVYKTGETNLIGVIVQRATGKSLTRYASEKLVPAAGLEGDLFWMVDSAGQNIGGCCLSMRLGDYARIGQLALEGGKGVVAPGWFADASAAKASIGMPGFGYGYQWWTYPGGVWGGQGIFGQAITIIPSKSAVIVVLSNWPRASSRDLRGAQMAFVQKLAEGL